MADGFIPSPEFNQQLRRTVAEVMRQSRFPVQSRTRWHKKGGVTAGGEGDGAGCCQATDEIYDRLLGNQIAGSGARIWTNPCGGNLPKVRCYYKGTNDSNLPYDYASGWMNRNQGYIEWTPPNEVRLIWDLDRNLYYYDIQPAELTVVDGSGKDLSTSETYSGYLTEDPFDGKLTISLYATDPQVGVSHTGGALYYLTPRGYQKPDYTKTIDYALNSGTGSNWNGPVPGPLNICSKASQEDAVASGIELTIDISFTAGSTAYEWNVQIDISVTNNTGEDVDVTYDPDAFAVNMGLQSSLYSSINFTVADGSTGTQTILTGVIISYTNSRLTCQGRVQGVGTVSSETYNSNFALTSELPS